MLKLTRLSILTYIFAGAAFGQGDMRQQSAPPELFRLQSFAGVWKSTAKMSIPGMPAGDFTSTDTYEWQKGNFFLIGHVDFASPLASGVELTVMGYDKAHRVYTYDTWTWSSTSGPLKCRYTEKLMTPSSMFIRFEVTQDGATWTPVMEGTSTKQ